MFEFIATAFAEDSRVAMPTSLMDNMANLMPIFIMFGIIYFLLIRPQVKKQREHSLMLQGLNKGDKIIAAGGLIGTIVKISNEEDHLHLELAPSVIIEVLKTSVIRIMKKDQIDSKVTKK